MNKYNIEGAIQLEGKKHTVEYEPGQMTGLGTLYLRLSDGKKNVPIFIDQIDEVIELLKAGKRAIRAIEHKDNLPLILNEIEEKKTHISMCIDISKSDKTRIIEGLEHSRLIVEGHI